MHIPVIRIFKENFAQVWEYKLEWARVGFAPFLIWAVGAAFMGIANWWFGHPLAFYEIVMGSRLHENIGQDEFLPMAGSIVNSITSFIAELMLFINGYRYALLNEGGHHWWTFHFNRRLVKMVLYFFLFVFLFGIYVFVAMGIIGISQSLFDNTILNVSLGIFAGLYGLYIFFRLGLFPLFIAIDQIKPMAMSWRLLKGNVLRFIGLNILLMVSLLAILLLGAVLLIPLLQVTMTNSFLNGGVSILAGLFLILMGFIYWSVFSKAGALVYEVLKDRLSEKGHTRKKLKSI